MALKTRLISVSTAATVLASSTVAANSTAALHIGGATLYDTVPIVVHSASTQSIYLGGSSMTTNSTNLGLPFTGPGYFTYNLLAAEPLFAITTAGAVSVTVQAGRS